MLEIIDLTKLFFGLTAVDHVSTRFERGQVSAIIGPNGAGKTTFFNLIAGTHRPSSGRILFNGQDVTGLRPDDVARLGIARTFQTTHLFDNATIIDNLIVGHRLRTRSGLWDVLVNSKRLQQEERTCRDKAMKALDFVGLAHISHRMAGDITQEERKRVALALALATDPGVAAARRTCRRRQPGGNRRFGHADSQTGRPRQDRVPDRAQNGHDHATGRQDRSAQQRRQDCRRDTGRYPARPAGD